MVFHLCIPAGYTCNLPLPADLQVSRPVRKAWLNQSVSLDDTALVENEGRLTTFAVMIAIADRGASSVLESVPVTVLVAAIAIVISVPVVFILPADGTVIAICPVLQAEGITTAKTVVTVYAPITASVVNHPTIVVEVT